MRETTIPVTVDAEDLRMVLEALAPADPANRPSEAVLNAFMRLGNAQLLARCREGR